MNKKTLTKNWLTILVLLIFLAAIMPTLLSFISTHNKNIQYLKNLPAEELVKKTKISNPEKNTDLNKSAKLDLGWPFPKLPDNATNIKLIDNQWVYFDLDGRSFLLVAYRHSSRGFCGLTEIFKRDLIQGP